MTIFLQAYMGIAKQDALPLIVCIDIYTYNRKVYKSHLCPIYFHALKHVSTEIKEVYRSPRIRFGALPTVCVLIMATDQSFITLESLLYKPHVATPAYIAIPGEIEAQYA